MQLVKEHIDFQRGLDPKEAMGTGVWKNGYMIVKSDELTQNDIDNLRAFRYTSKPCEVSDINRQIDHMEINPDILERIPIINFKQYYNQGSTIGFFGDWPRDFPFRRTMFMAHVRVRLKI